MIQQVAQHGVVGAGGAGFPTARKLETSADTFLVNAAECEPLLHKDKELLLHHADAVLAGLEIGMRCAGAARAVVGVKEKYGHVIAALTPMLPSGVEICPLRDSYPAGDEFVLVHDTLGRIIPPGGLPLDVGAVVANVETLANIGFARPVTRKFLTVAGAVEEPVTLCAPVGAPLSALLDAAGGATADECAFLLNGVMMGRVPASLDEPVTKTTGGLIVLPSDHPLVARYSRSPAAVDRIGRSACDQCSFCTELCPRYLLGHPIEPHKAMRALGFAPNKEAWIAGSLYCCECNLCSLYSCPEDLDPRDVCASQKPLAREIGLAWRGEAEGIRAHPVIDGRRVPMKRHMSKLGLNRFRNEGPLRAEPLAVDSVTLLLSQHIGAPCEPVVGDGASVREGDLIASPPSGKLGANIHASIEGVVTVMNDRIAIDGRGC